MKTVCTWPFRAALAGFVIAAMAPGCGGAPASARQDAAAPVATEAAPESPAVQPLPSLSLAIVTTNGARHTYRVEVARTADEQAQGLMHRRAMPRDAGMLFPFRPARPASFWMRNTFIPLDMIFVRGDGRIESILADVPPLTETSRQSLGPVAAVLELNAGEAARIGARAGDLVAYDLGDLQGSPE